MLHVEIIYIGESPLHICLALNPGATVAEALALSGIYEVYPEIRTCKIGIFAKSAQPSDRLQHGDRIELYRPLVCDPKEKRRQLARKTRIKIKNE